METNTKNGAHARNGAAKHTRASLPLNGGSKNEPGDGQKHDPEKGSAKAEEHANAPGKELGDQVSPEQEKPAAGAEHHEGEEAETANPALTLEAKLKAVDTLHRKSVQRINLISRMSQLEAFEVLLTQEHDELEDNPYQGCKLIIEDDKKRQFITTTPGLIRLVSQFIFDACNEKRAEIEAAIVFPNA